MQTPLKRSLSLVVLAAMLTSGAACSSYQPTKNVWKGTKELWYEYVSPPASIDYSETGTLTEQGQALVDGMMGIDIELNKLERLMTNADRPPTRGWLTGFFSEVPWVDGFTGMRADGTLLGTEVPPGKPTVTVDYIPLLYEPEKQGTRALRGDMQQTAIGPVVLLAAPLYDGVDFLGVVATYFRITNIIDRVKKPESVVIFTPHGLLWSPFDYGATPMAGINWHESVTKASSGVVTNERGSFVYQVRWLGNLPIIFAVVEQGDFPKSSGSLAGSEKFFPVREKMPVPPQKERTRPAAESGGAEFLPPQPGQEAHTQPGSSSASDLEAGSSDSMLLQQPAPARKSRVRERDLEGENTTYQPRPRPRAQQRRLPPIIIPDMPEEPVTPPPTFERPSPFGPRTASQPDAAAATPETTAPESTAAPAAEAPAQTPAQAPAEAGTAPASPRMPAMLPGGRPSPFGPRPAPAAEPAAEAAPAEASEAPAAPAAPARPSPFGPRPAAPAAESAAPAAPAAPAAETPAAPAAPAAETPAAPAAQAAPQAAPAAPAAPFRPSPFGPRPAAPAAETPAAPADTAAAQ